MFFLLASLSLRFFFFFFIMFFFFFFFFSSRRRHTRSLCDWSSDVCSSDLAWFDSIKASPYTALLGRDEPYDHSTFARAGARDPGSHWERRCPLSGWVH